MWRALDCAHDQLMLGVIGSTNSGQLSSVRVLWTKLKAAAATATDDNDIVDAPACGLTENDTGHINYVCHRTDVLSTI